MVLGSQSPRPGMDRLYRVSGRRRRGAKRSWLVLILLLAVVGILIYALTGFGTDDTPQQADASATPDTTTQTTPPSPPVNTLRLDGRPVVIPEPEPTEPPAPSSNTQITTLVATDGEPLIASVPEASAPWQPQIDPQTEPAIAQAAELMEANNLLEARRVLSRALYTEEVPAKPIADVLRGQLADINAELVFTDRVTPGDDLAERYRIQPGDFLSRIGPRYDIPYQLIERINGIEANRIRAGQYLKVLRGPLHVRVVRSQYVMDVFGRDPQGEPVHVISFPVGLGENDSTPDGMWLVEPGRKVINPDWRNPRTGEYYSRDDPANPIGNYWIALEGMDAQTAGQRGYGIHGTIEPDSIGSQASMGCVRLRDEDIELLYFMLASGDSTVEIRE
ncbi:L,D-transpeptidase family protein [Mucisphaera sp.]|uniref:L,D-transpeptidase family protein n=1 Tax=Mucisphaera sp. TaxID=2913024 RepID=UPI003D11B222